MNVAEWSSRMQFDSMLNGITDSGLISRIGKIINTEQFANKRDEIRERVYQSYINNGAFNTIKDAKLITRLLSVLSEHDEIDMNEALEECLILLENQSNFDQLRKKFLVKWIRTAAIYIDAIPEFVKQFNSAINPQQAKGGKIQYKKWKGESPRLISNRAVLVDVDMFPLMNKRVKNTFEAFDQVSREIVLIDISYSMVGDPNLMTMLYVWNRIEHVRKGNLHLQIVLFNSITQRVSFWNQSGEDIYVFSPDTMRDESDFAALENRLFEMIVPTGSTKLEPALRLMDEEDMTFPVPSASNVVFSPKRVVTILTDDGSASSYKSPNTVYNVLLSGNNDSLRNLAISTGGICTSITSLIDKI